MSNPTEGMDEGIHNGESDDYSEVYVVNVSDRLGGLYAFADWDDAQAFCDVVNAKRENEYEHVVPEDLPLNYHDDTVALIEAEGRTEACET